MKRYGKNILFVARDERKKFGRHCKEGLQEITTNAKKELFKAFAFQGKEADGETFKLQLLAKNYPKKLRKGFCLRGSVRLTKRAFF